MKRLKLAVEQRSEGQFVCHHVTYIMNFKRIFNWESIDFKIQRSEKE